jgi:hypothetical protein
MAPDMSEERTARDATSRPRSHRGGRLAAVCAAVLLMGTASCGSSDESPQSLPSATVPQDAASAPSGWQTRQGAGFTIAIPPQWQNRPDDQRAAASAALEVGVPYTGQSEPPPLLLAFVERELVGPLSIREQVLRAQLTAGLPPDATIGASKHVKIAGSTDAVTFDVTYRTQGGTSVTGVTLKPTTVRQRELVVETPGLPKYGFRYAAPLDQFSEDTWAKIQGSITVRAGGSGDSGDATGSVS